MKISYFKLLAFNKRCVSAYSVQVSLGGFCSRLAVYFRILYAYPEVGLLYFLWQFGKHKEACYICRGCPFAAIPYYI